MTTLEQNFLKLIIVNPGIEAASLPRRGRGYTLKVLALDGLIHYGPGGWFATRTGELAAMALNGGAK